MHTELFTFSLDLEIEIVNLRAKVEEQRKEIVAPALPRGNGIARQEARLSKTTLVTLICYIIAIIFDQRNISSMLENGILMYLSLIALFFSLGTRLLDHA